MSRTAANAKLAEYRSALVVSSISVDQAWHLPWEEIKEFPILPGHTLTDDKISVSKDMLPAKFWQLGNRTIDFELALPDGWKREEERSEACLRRLKRIALLNFTQTVPGPKENLKPSQAHTWVQSTRRLLVAAKQALTIPHSRRGDTSSCPDGTPIFRNLSPESFQQLRNDNPSFFHVSIARLNGLYNAGLFDDWPAGDVSATIFQTDPVQPYSDDAFTEILGACFFLASIQTDLEACYREVLSITQDPQGRTEVQKYLRPYRHKYVAKWSGEVLRLGFAFPYQFEISGVGTGGKKRTFSSWPVLSYAAVKSLLLLCQAANAQIIDSATAGRVSELSTLGRDPLVQLNGNHLLSGLTFKGSENPSGSEREWPLSYHAVEAVRRQQRLRETLNESGPYLWCTGLNTTTGVCDLSHAVKSFGRKVRTCDGISLAEIDGDLSPHRYRKTLSRLVGLALEGASGILYDVLGHTDMDVTLGYMLADPDFREDADRVRREVQLVRRKEVAAELDNCGGPAARGLRIARDDMRARAIREDLGDDDPELLMAIFPALQQVGPSRFCTADSKQKGLCSKVTGSKDVGACNASCVFRLERAAAAKDRKDSVESALDILSGDVSIGIRVFYEGQIIANLAPFEATIDAFAGDMRLREALKNCDPRAFEPLPSSTREKLEKMLEQV